MSPDDDRAVCPQCGAIGCRDKYGEILALEFEQPAVFWAMHQPGCDPRSARSSKTG
jgi:hypothetical protein